LGRVEDVVDDHERVCHTQVRIYVVLQKHQRRERLTFEQKHNARVDERRDVPQHAAQHIVLRHDQLRLQRRQ
jgi:hypothetical protein